MSTLEELRAQIDDIDVRESVGIVRTAHECDAAGGRI